MIPVRQIKIAIVAIAVVVVAFLIWSNNSETGDIELTTEKEGEVLHRPDFDDSPRIDGSTIESATNSAFVTRDPVTKKVVRKFGFEKLLNPEKNSEKWRLQRPYMEFFGDKFKSRITSDEGNFQVQQVMNKITTQNARLYGNVKLEITFLNEGVPTDGVIYLEDLDYDSERSELHTDKSVRAVFDDAVMEGTGMTLIYNSAKSRIEYFDLKDLDFIRIKNVAMLSEERKDEKQESTASGQPVKPASGTNGEKVAASSKPEKAPTPAQQDDYYHCRFLKNVNIEYGDELVVRAIEELNIKNLLFSQSGPKDSTSVDQPDQKSANSPSPKQDKPVVVKSVDANSNTIVASVDADTDSNSPKATEVVLTCKEGFVVQLMSKVNAEKAKTPPTAKTISETLSDIIANADAAKVQATGQSSHQNPLIAATASANLDIETPNQHYANFLADEKPATAAKPTRFRAKKIDYDMTTKYAYATGPINLLIYAKPESQKDADKPQVPIKITAVDNAEYFGIKDQMVFNGQVVGMRKITGEEFVTENSVHGDQLVVDLDSSVGDNSLGHVAVLGKKVQMFSRRFNGDKLLTNIRLGCERIDYDSKQEFITAKGPGVIEIDNSKAAPLKSETNKKTGSQVSLKEPCYGLIKDFDVLKMYTQKNMLVADGTSGSVKMQHIPVISLEPQKFGKVTFAAARHIEAIFSTTPDGRTELGAVTASQTVSFMEKDGKETVNSFIGDKLYYNVEQSMMLVTGTEGNPCILNGMSTEKIRYDLASEEVVTGISGPASFQLPPKPKDLDKR